jgi:hypothetical protein
LIQEFLTYLTERPLLKEARSFGHLYESISLLSREKRCKNAWGPHRAECKKFILKYLSLATSKDAILILGSGPLHEIPIEEIAMIFNKVTLVDIVHLQSTKKSVSHLKNIEFIEHDITEKEAELKKLKTLTPKAPLRFIDQNWDMVISVNLMSQLPIHYQSFVEKNLKAHFTENAVDHFLKELTLQHFLYLKSFNSPVLLITDTHSDYFDPMEKLLQTDDNYTHINMPQAAHTWVWRVAPIPEFRKDIEIRMRVSGFLLNSSK